MSNQPPYDGSQDPFHEQPTQAVPNVEDPGQGGKDSGSWGAPDTYGQQTPRYGESNEQYGGSTPAYGQSPYGQAPQYGQQGGYDGQQGGYNGQQDNGGYDQQGYGYGNQPGYYAPAPQQGGSNTSAIVLTVASGIATLFCCGSGIPSLIFGIIALTKQQNDPAGSAKMTKIGWIVFAVLVVLAIIAIIIYFAVIINYASDNPRYSDTYSDPSF